MGDALRSSHLSVQKQNREGVADAQSGQYRVMTEPSLGCDIKISINYTLNVKELLKIMIECS